MKKFFCKYDIYVAPDCQSVNLNESEKQSSKSWFHYSVKGFRKNSTVKFNIYRVHMLYALYMAKAEQYYRPVYKINEGDWERLNREVSINVTKQIIKQAKRISNSAKFFLSILRRRR